MFYSFIFKLNISNDTRRTELSFSSATGQPVNNRPLLTTELTDNKRGQFESYANTNVIPY